MVISTKKPQKANIHVTGMTCTTCAFTVQKALAKLHGVDQARVNFASEKATIDYDPAKVDLGKIRETITESGYGIAARKSIFPVRGMTCASCVARVEEALNTVP